MAEVLTIKMSREKVEALLTHQPIGLAAEAMEELEAALQADPCDHEWVDPSNEVVEAGAWRLCLRCGLYAIPEEVSG